MVNKEEKPFTYDWKNDRPLYWNDLNIGWIESDHNASIWSLGIDDPLYYYMRCNIDIGFYYNGHKYWIESPVEELRDHEGDDVWSLAICDKPNPKWTGTYIDDQYEGLERHDAENRTELFFCDGIDEFIANAKIDGRNLREVLNESFIKDL